MSFRGGETAALDTLLAGLGREDNVWKLESSHPDRLSVRMGQQNWYLTAPRPFDGEIALTLYTGDGPRSLSVVSVLPEPEEAAKETAPEPEPITAPQPDEAPQSAGSAPDRTSQLREASVRGAGDGLHASHGTIEYYDGVTAQVPGVYQGDDASDFAASAPKVNIYIDNSHFTPDRAELTLLYDGPAGLLVETTMPSGSRMVSFNQGYAYSIGQGLSSTRDNFFAGPIASFTYRDLAILDDGTTADLVITYSDLHLVLQDNIQWAPDNFQTQAQLSLFWGNELHIEATRGSYEKNSVTASRWTQRSRSCGTACPWKVRSISPWRTSTWTAPPTPASNGSTTPRPTAAIRRRSGSTAAICPTPRATPSLFPAARRTTRTTATRAISAGSPRMETAICSAPPRATTPTASTAPPTAALPTPWTTARA